MTHTKVFKQKYKLRGCDNRESKIVWMSYSIFRRLRKQHRHHALQVKLRKVYGVQIQ
jgi:hypothetical protein